MGIDSTQIKFYTMPGDRYWIRDHGAAFLVNEKGELGVADFEWNSYGRPYWIQEKYDNHPDSIQKYYTANLAKMNKTGRVDSLMAIAENAKIQKVKVKHEGGAIEVNGKGTLILCEATVFQRNPGMSREELESEFKKGLGVSNIIWMKKGLADDPQSFFRGIVDNYIGGGTGGHTDEFVRFANLNTVLLAWVDEAEKDLNPINKMNYERMKENFDILSQSKDQDGNPLNVIKVPLPDLIVKKVVARWYSDAEGDTTFDVRPSSFKPSEAPQVGDTLQRVPASSYMNYLVTNGIVILPSYVHVGSSKEKEQRVKEIFQQQFPDREIVFIDAMPINWSGGGIHCSTQQQPKRTK
jgi:agmatine deiminase